MAEFANKQKAFMKQMNEEFSNTNQEQENDDLTIDVCNKIQYECVICGQTTPSTPERLGNFRFKRFCVKLLLLTK